LGTLRGKTRVLAALAPLALALVGCSHAVERVPAPTARPLVHDERIPEPVTPELNFEGFNPGNIISDEVFFNSETMSVQEIQDFLDEVGYGCREGSVPCISQYVEDTKTYAGGKYCGDYVGAEGESAAEIIYYSALQCSINPQVLLVMLQKEQGLLTASGFRLNESRYEIAMGYGCPDNADCGSEFYGFSNQVYSAAKQLKRYQTEPGQYRVKPGQENQILFNPDPDCGESTVYVENAATAALYNYTPYQPGGEDGCASHGNLNFYAYFNAWFG